MSRVQMISQEMHYNLEWKYHVKYSSPNTVLQYSKEKEHSHMIHISLSIFVHYKDCKL